MDARCDRGSPCRPRGAVRTRRLSLWPTAGGPRRQRPQPAKDRVQPGEQLELRTKHSSLSLHLLAEESLAKPVELGIEPVVLLDEANCVVGQRRPRRPVSTHVLSQVKWVSPAEYALHEHQRAIKLLGQTDRGEMLRQVPSSQLEHRLTARSGN